MDYLLPPEEHRTDRLLLRSWRPGDGAALSEAVNGSYAHLKTFMPWAVPHQDVQTSERLVRQFRGRWLLSQDFVVALFTPDGSRALGGCGFHLRHGPLRVGVAEIGMWLRAEAAGQGLGTHALETLIDWGFSEWPWQRLVWKCDAENHASRRCAEKAGMVLEGVSLADELKVGSTERRDTAWYAALRPTLGS